MAAMLAGSRRRRTLGVEPFVIFDRFVTTFSYAVWFAEGLKSKYVPARLFGWRAGKIHSERLLKERMIGV
jgi:hypothetical protein